MMRKFFIICITLIFFTRVFGEITSIEQDHKNIAQENKSGIQIKYHTDNYDLLYSGTKKWAVCFNFSEYFTNTENSDAIFKPQRLKIFSGDTENVTLSILGGNATTPNDTVFVSYENTPFIYGWNTIELPVNLDLRNIFWVVISSDSIINSAASYGNGAHSYYWVQTTETDGYFANMQDYNFHSELLFTFEGIFTSNVHNLEFAKFNYINNSVNPQIYSPQIKIINNGMNPISNIKVNINIDSSAPDFNPYVKEIDFPNELSAGDSLFINAPDSLNISFSEEFSQYNFQAILSCSDTLDFSYDNSQGYSLNYFPNSQDIFLLENFLISSDPLNTDLWNYQSSADSPDFLKINYFPAAYDSPYQNAESLSRFNFYSGIGYPTTIMNGSERLTNFNDNYQSKFQTFADSLNLQKTFISNQENYGSYNDEGKMTFRAILNNQETYLFSNFASSLKLFVALIQDSFDDVVPQNLFRGFISSSTGDNINLNNQETGEISLEWNKADFETIPADDWNNCKIVYWIQSNDKIYFVSSLNISDFEHLVSNDDENAPQISLKTGPNPFNPIISKYKIIFNDKKRENSIIKIFNIKGQLVRRLFNDKKNPITYWDGRDSNNSNCASGIYFMKIFNNKKTFNKKIILVK